MRWTRSLAPILTAGDRLLDRVVCVVGAVLFSQLPEFFQQYLQRLGGHLAEAQRQLDAFRRAATESGMTLDGLIAQTSAQSEPTVARLGAVMADTRARVQDLAGAESALHDASMWSRPFVFVRHLDPGIARATWAVFRPAVPTTAEGLVYAAVGTVLGLAFYHAAVRYPVRCAWRARSARRRAPEITASRPAG